MQLSNDQIRQILPHRYPFLLLDRVIGYEPGQWAKAIKCVSAGEPFFQGHFPTQSMMPGVLVLEAIAQAGAVALLTMPENQGRLAVFGGVKNARFLRRVTPGDVLELECSIIRSRGGVGIGVGVARVGDNIVCRAELTFAITAD